MGKTKGKGHRSRKRLRAEVRKARDIVYEHGWGHMYDQLVNLQFLADELAPFANDSDSSEAVETLQTLPSALADLLRDLESAVDVVLDDLKRKRAGVAD